MNQKLSLTGLPQLLLRYILLIGSSGMILLTMMLLFGAWRTGSRFMAGIESFFFPHTTIPQVDIPTLIVQQMQEASELTTTVFVMEAVVPTSQERKLGEFVLATTKLLYLAHGEVRAGVDLNQLTKDNIKIAKDSVQIKLPPPIILDSKIDVTRSQVYDYNRGFLGLGPDVAPHLQTLAQRETLAKIVATACSQGVLEEANARAKLVVTQLLQTAGYQQVKVETTAPLLDSCVSKN